MDIEIEDAVTLKMIEELVALTGKDAEEVVMEALQERLDRLRGAASPG